MRYRAFTSFTRSQHHNNSCLCICPCFLTWLIYELHHDKTCFFIIQNSKPLTIFCGCTAWFVSDLVGNPEDRFFFDMAHMILTLVIMAMERMNKRKEVI